MFSTILQVVGFLTIFMIFAILLCVVTVVIAYQILKDNWDEVNRLVREAKARKCVMDVMERDG